MVSNRTAAERIKSAKRRLGEDDNVWIATASMNGEPHLVPLSLAWDGEAILVATPANTPTACNAAASGHVRATLDSTVDVVLLLTDAVVTSFSQVSEKEAAIYVNRVGWDPRDEPGEWSLLRLTPSRVQAWNSVNEIDGRTIMRDGVWVE